MFWLGVVGTLLTARRLLKYDYLSVSVISICGMFTVLHIYIPDQKILQGVPTYICGPGSSVGIATGYRLDGPGSDPTSTHPLGHTGPVTGKLYITYLYLGFY